MEEIIIAELHYKMYDTKETIKKYNNIEKLKEDIRSLNDYIGPLSFKVKNIHPDYKEEINEFIKRIIG